MNHIIKMIIIVGILVSVSACASRPARSISELQSRAHDDSHGDVKTLVVPRSYSSVYKQVENRMQKCLRFSLKISDEHGAQQKWVHRPKMAQLGKDYVRMYFETEYTDYGIFSDDVSTQYNFMVDVQKVAPQRTKVTTYAVYYDNWSDSIIDDLKGKKDAVCPSDPDDPNSGGGSSFFGFLGNTIILLVFLSAI